jgi:hypothetical protein
MASTATSEAGTATAGRQPNQRASGGRIEAPIAPPSGRPTCLSPTAVARWRRGNQAIAALAVVGLSMP